METSCHQMLRYQLDLVRNLSEMSDVNRIRPRCLHLFS